MKKKNKYTGKFVVAFDTLCEGWNCMTDENDKGKRTPSLFDSYNEAFKEIFDGAYSMLSNRSASELKEYSKGVTKIMVKQMGKILDSGDVKAMEKFFDQNPNCNDNNEWVEPADQFIMNRKVIFTKKGLVITGKKLK